MPANLFFSCIFNIPWHFTRWKVNTAVGLFFLLKIIWASTFLWWTWGFPCYVYVQIFHHNPERRYSKVLIWNVKEIRKYWSWNWSRRHNNNHPYLKWKRIIFSISIKINNLVIAYKNLINPAIIPSELDVFFTVK